MTSLSGLASRLARHLSAALLAAFAVAAVAAAAQAPVDLGSAGNFTILSKSGISTVGTTAVVGNMGVSPIDSTAITGFGLSLDPSTQFATSSLVNGKIYAADYSAPTPAVLTTAVSDMETAYTNAAGRTLPDATELGAGNIGGMTLAPGLYKWGTGVTIPTNVTLSGGANAVWIFQIAQTLDVSTGAQVVLSGGAQAQNVFWQVGAQATLNTTSVCNGNILSQTAIVIKTGATLHGKALAQTAVTLDASQVDSAAAGYTGPNPPAAGHAFAYPSPGKPGAVNLVYVMAEPGRVAIRVWNVTGDLVRSLDEPKPATGPQRTRIETGAFASGIYLYRIILTYDSGKVEKLPVQKFAVSQ